MPTNPYISEGPPEMRPSLVCYADILGYRSLSRCVLGNGMGAGFLAHLHRALAGAHQRVRDHAESTARRLWFATDVFTDHIVVGYPLLRPQSDLGEPEMYDILGIFAEFQIGLAMEGFFLRGGIAYGNHYMDQDVVFGDALLEAVELDKTGEPPRLVLAPSALDLVHKHLASHFSVESSWYYEHLLKDSDGVTFLDYLSQAFMAFPDGGVFLELIEAHRDSVTAGLHTYQSKLEVQRKYEWAAHYHDFVCRDFIERHPVSCDPDGDEVYGAATVQAQGLLKYLIDLPPSPFWTERGLVQSQAPSPKCHFSRYRGANPSTSPTP